MVDVLLLLKKGKEDVVLHEYLLERGTSSGGWPSQNLLRALIPDIAKA